MNGTTPDALPPITLSNAWRHFKTITAHKLGVMRLCFKVGLYAQGLKHDLSKYGPTEFLVGARFYQGYRSPNVAERECRGFTEAWLHHKGRNKHHSEYWLDAGDGITSANPAPMPTRYIIEMFCDRVAACKTYQGDQYSIESPWTYYDRFKHRIVMHPASRAQLERLLRLLADEGEEAALNQVRQMVKNRVCEGPSARF